MEALVDLALLALLTVLAIGIVVDDAIVVVENTTTHLNKGLNSKDAALDMQRRLPQFKMIYISPYHIMFLCYIILYTNISIMCLYPNILHIS